MANDCHPCVPAPQNYNWAGWCILGVVAPVRGVVVSTPTPKKISFVHRLIGSTTYDGMPYLKPEIVYPFNRQYSMSAAKVCWVNSVACN